MFFLQFKNSRSKNKKIKKTLSLQGANTPPNTKHTHSQSSLDKSSNHQHIAQIDIYMAITC